MSEMGRQATRDLLVMARALHGFLTRHNINPDTLSVVIRANDEQTFYRVSCAVEAAEASLARDGMLVGPKQDTFRRAFTVHGIKFLISTLDVRA